MQEYTIFPLALFNNIVHLSYKNVFLHLNINPLNHEKEKYESLGETISRGEDELGELNDELKVLEEKKKTLEEELSGMSQAKDDLDNISHELEHKKAELDKRSKELDG